MPVGDASAETGFVELAFPHFKGICLPIPLCNRSRGCRGGARRTTERQGAWDAVRGRTATAKVAKCRRDRLAPSRARQELKDLATLLDAGGDRRPDAIAPPVV